jgi:hypothetical protein
MYEKFSPYEGQYSIMSMTDIRNNHDVRFLFCETGASVALCRKAKLPSLPKIKAEHDFQQIVIQENLKAPSSIYARGVIKKDDPMELYIPLNEFCYCLKPETRDTARALYWASWILKYASNYKHINKTVLLCSYRSNEYVEEKYLRYTIWLLWSAIWDATYTSPQSGTVTPYVDAVYKMYCLKWSVTDMKKRLPFLINAILFLTESNTLDIHYSVPHDIQTVQSIVTNIPQWIAAIIQTQKTFA